MRRIGPIALALCACAGIALADADTSKTQVKAALARATKALQQRKSDVLVRELESALAAARAAAPLEVRRAEVVGRAHTGLGLFDPLPDAEVPGRHLQLYVEVANFATRQLGDKHQVQLKVEGTFYFEDGTALGTQQLGTHQFLTRSPTGLTSFGLDVRLGEKSPPGGYRIDLKVLDELGHKAGAREVVFRLK